jgi:hypothetical protein
MSDRWPVHITHFPSGWLTQRSFVEYLPVLHSHIADGPLCLAIDQHSAIARQFPRHPPPTSASDSSHPEGGDGDLTPSDRRVDRDVKSKERARRARLFGQSDISITTRGLAAEFALQSWDGVVIDESPYDQLKENAICLGKTMCRRAMRRPSPSVFCSSGGINGGGQNTTASGRHARCSQYGRTAT